MGGVLVLDDGTVLHDDIDAEPGQHVLVYRSPEREAVQVAGVLDPDDRAGAGSAPPVVPDLRRLSDTAATISTMDVAPVWPSDGPRRRVRSFGTDDGLWLVEGDGNTASESMPRQGSADGIDDLARRLLYGRFEA